MTIMRKFVMQEKKIGKKMVFAGLQGGHRRFCRNKKRSVDLILVCVLICGPPCRYPFGRYHGKQRRHNPPYQRVSLWLLIC